MRRSRQDEEEKQEREAETKNTRARVTRAREIGSGCSSLAYRQNGPRRSTISGSSRRKDEPMKINGELLSSLFQPGGTLDGATVRSAELYGENYSDGSADGCEILFLTKRGGLALLTLDAFDSEGISTRYLSTDEAERTAADARDRKHIAELEAQAEAIRRQYPALQAIHAAAHADADRSAHALDD